MPSGILTDVIVTAFGGVIGCCLGSRISQEWKQYLNNLLGIAALVMGIVLIMRVHTLSVAILSLLLGACIGQFLQLEHHVNQGANLVIAQIMAGAKANEAQLLQISAALVLFCFGGTGWYGALNEGLTGDGTILVTKAILDGITGCIFAALLGRIIPCLCVAQLGVYMTLFFVSSFVSPFITPEMIADFSATGGIITLIAGLRLSGIKKDIHVLNLLPSLIIAFLVSSLWTQWIG